MQICKSMNKHVPIQCVTPPLKQSLFYNENVKLVADMKFVGKVIV